MKVRPKRALFSPLIRHASSSLSAALDELEAEGVNSKAVNIARLWVLTGCRRDEIAGLKWSEVNLRRDCLVWTKGGRGSPSVLWALPQLLFLALCHEKRRRTSHSRPSAGYFQGPKSVWSKAIKRAQLLGVMPRVLRHTIGSTAISSGEALALTGAILGHFNPHSTDICACAE